MFTCRLRGHAMNDGHLVQPIKIARAYEQLAGLLRERITSGDLREGDRLPSETALAKQAGVSRSTVREALRILEQGGLVERASPRIMVVSDRTDVPAFRELRRELRRRNVTFHHLHEALLDLRPGADPVRRDPRRPQRPAGAARIARGPGAPPRPPRRVEPARRRVPRGDGRDERQPGADHRPRADQPAAAAGALPLHGHARNGRARDQLPPAHRQRDRGPRSRHRRLGHAQAHKRLAHRLGETRFGSPPRDPRSLLHHPPEPNTVVSPHQEEEERTWASSRVPRRSPV